jgi:hypothetical protein
MQMADAIRIQVLSGGLVKLETDRISSPNHLSADRLVRGLEEDLGGETEIRRKAEGTLEHDHRTTHHDIA